jgi:hypothetical protein
MNNLTPNKAELSATVNPCNLAAVSIAACLAFRDKAESAKAAAKAAVKSAIEVFGEKDAAARVRVLLTKEHGIDRRRVSEALLEFGFRARAKSAAKVDKSEELKDVIASLIARAQELAGDDAVVALRRAYLSLQAKKD